MKFTSSASKPLVRGRVFIMTYKYPLIATFIILIILTWQTAKDAEEKYQSQLSVIIYDRHNVPLSIKTNIRDHYVAPTLFLESDFEKLLLEKEDKYFYYHVGINPISTLRAFINYLREGEAGGASTITQQLTKNLLGTESKRNLKNKLKESFYAFSLELFSSKKEILIMYANSVYLGNQIQGFETASQAYFNKSLKNTSYSEKISLLATLSNPSTRNPWQEANKTFSKKLHQKISLKETFVHPKATDKYSFQDDAFFELRTSGLDCSQTCQTTIDSEITKTIRGILNRQLAQERDRGARNGAVAVIDPKNSEIIALVGSKNPSNQSDGDQINMTIEPRPIGSTVKPLIYLKGFMSGLRPYTMVEDREYKYSIATGFSLYPKNYDGKYRGEVTLHEALSNSLNVPTVKTLEYIGLNNFYSFLSNDLKFKPIQDYDNYQYGIALGGLEMDLLTLTHYFTLFPKAGIIEPVKIFKNDSENFSLPPQSNITTRSRISESKYTELIHTILKDRLSGVNQFGLESNLNILAKDYGVKTGTSRDYHDSWVVGYTGDYVVGVWIGNTENEPLKQISGSVGAGAVWHDVMNLLVNSNYHHDSQIILNEVVRWPINESDEWGLPDDNISIKANLLTASNLILSPQNHDVFQYFKDITIPLTARTESIWSSNGKVIGAGKELSFKPTDLGNYEITAQSKDSNKREIIEINITE